MNPSEPPRTLPASDPPTSVHPLETTVTPEDALASRPTDPLAYGFRHASWHALRTHVFRALADLHQSARISLTRCDRFADCGRTAWILRHRTDHTRYKIVLDACHDRFCVPCGRARAQVVAENLSRNIAHTPHRLLTLTLAHSLDSLPAQLDRLFRSFKRLRSRSLWKERCKGGAALLELAFNPATRLWHPHLHVIITGLFLPHAQLKATWLDITGDSSIVDIRLIRHTKSLVDYVTKYVTKPLPASVIRDPDALKDAIVALNGRKTLFAFGSWARWRLLDPHDSDEWTLYSHVNALPFGLPADAELNAQLLRLYANWAHHDGPAEFTIRGPPDTPPLAYSPSSAPHPQSLREDRAEVAFGSEAFGGGPPPYPPGTPARPWHLNVTAAS